MAAPKTAKDNLVPSKEKQELSREMFSLFNYIGVSVAVVDKTGKIIFVNDRILRLWGYSREELTGKRFSILKVFTPQSMAKALAAFSKRIVGTENAPYEIETRRKDGSVVITEVHGFPLTIGGKTAGIVATLFDVSERRKNEEEIKQRNEELEKFYKIAVGRELRIEELKKKVADLESQLGAKQD